MWLGILGLGFHEYLRFEDLEGFRVLGYGVRVRAVKESSQ